jgi:phospholipid/cholesterol/gamma-HCH transport system substrate-binding protein
MTERQLQFRVGIFVIVAMVIMVGMVFAFGNVGSYWDKSYTIGVHFT